MPEIAGVKIPEGCPSIVDGETRSDITNIVYGIKSGNLKDKNPCSYCDNRGMPCCKATYKK